MTGVWFAYALLVGVLLAGMARALSEACRLAGRPTRWVWLAGLGLTVVLVSFAPYRTVPPAPAPLTSTLTIANASPLPEGAWVVAPEPSAPRWFERVRAVGPAVAAPMQAAIAAVGTRVPEGLMRHFTALWVVLSTLLFGLCLATYVRFYRLRRLWPVANLDGVRVRIAPDGGPAVVGWSRPEIIVPSWLLCHTREERRLVIAHEWEHLNARDPLLIAIGCIIAVLLPWHPAVWWMFARLRLAVELDCDSRVLRQGIAPRQYGALLIDLAGRSPGLPVGAPALADKSSHLRQRLLAMRAPRLSFARTRGAALGVLALAVLVAACLVQIPNVVAQAQRPVSELVAAADPQQPVQVLSMLEATAPAPAQRRDSTTTRVVRRRKQPATARPVRIIANDSAVLELGKAMFDAPTALMLVGGPVVRMIPPAGNVELVGAATFDTADSKKLVAAFTSTDAAPLASALNVLLRQAPIVNELHFQLDSGSDSASHPSGGVDLPIVGNAGNSIALDFNARLTVTHTGRLTAAKDSAHGFVMITTFGTDKKP